MNTLFEQAELKVKYNEKLNKYADKILADWPEGEEHWQWVLDASDEEIIEWAEAGLTKTKQLNSTQPLRGLFCYLRHCLFLSLAPLR